MHFEILVEDQSGSIAIEVILKKILGVKNLRHSWAIHSYKGIGHIPRDLHEVPDPKKQFLLNHLPMLLRGYGRSLGEPAAVIAVMDLDNRDGMAFKQELLDVLYACNPRPNTLFRFAIEESEAWLLGDRNAVKAAYPNAKELILNRYVQDSICGTWEVLADSIHPGGSARLKKLGYRSTGKAKCDWANEIAVHMDVNQNQSKSFQVFRDGVRRLGGIR